MIRSFPIRCGGFLLILLSLSFSANATHIVGGEINYRCLGGNDYEITLQIYRDCFNGVPYFDTPASIGIFDQNNALLYDLRVMPIGDDTLDLQLSNPCLVVPPNVCYHTTFYRDTINLPFLEGGYQLAYQRCCRNQSIVNIQLPLETGATYYSYISEEALNSCNSSAYFNEWPPFFICKDIPFVFDHFAIDIDGDSIAYKMCAPFDGASFDVPQPQPPNNPPYDSVVWITPPYNTQNMLGGIPLSIDQNGLLTAIPNTVGQFVVGICAEEYRNGELISTTRRDFQFNVGNCGLQVVSSFFAPEIQCGDDLEVFFNNQSSGSNSFFWDFGDGNSSSMDSPLHTFPDTGTYEITLIAGPGQACSDTSTQLVNVQYQSLFVEFDLNYVNCVDSIVIDYIDLSFDTLSNIVLWRWDLGNGEVAETQFPEIVYTQPGTYTITLEVQAENGCTASATETVVFETPVAGLPDSLVICPGDGPVQLNPGGSSGFEYQWSPSDGLDDPNSPSPFANPEETTTYTVETSTSNNFDTCFVARQVTVIVSPEIDIIAPQDTAFCEAGFNLTPQIFPDSAMVVWSDQPDFSNVLNPNGEVFLMVPDENAETYYVQAINEFGCFDSDSVQVENRAIQLDLSDPEPVCFGTPVMIVATALDPSDQTLYNWQPSDSLISGQGSAEAIFDLSVSQWITLQTSNQFSCTRTDSVFVEVALPISVDAGPDLNTCQESLTLTASADNSNGLFNWSENPDFSVVLNPDGGPSVLVSPGTASLFYVQTFNDLGCEARDSVLVSGQSANLEASGDSLICFPDTAKLQVVNLDPSDQLSYTWEPGAFILPPPNEAEVFAVPEQSTYFVVTGVNQFGCSARDSVWVEVSDLIPVLDLSADPTEIFPGEHSQLEATNDPDYAYSWFPAQTLSDPAIFNPTASPEESTTYTVSIEDEFGCVNTAEINIRVKSFICGDPNIFVPSAFTPNGDGLNEVLFVRGNLITDLYFVIYNRWGEQVFESESLDIGWDGTFKGQQLSPDVFGYYLRVRCLNGEEFSKKGNITLIR